MNTTQMHAHVQEYLQLRRALGFKLAWPGHLLPQFVDYLADTGSETITVEAAIAWARLRRDACPITLSHRLGAVRGFARYLASIDPATEIPPLGVFGKQQRRIPFIYSPEQIRLLVAAAGQLCPPLKAATFQALLGLLGVSGMRVGEALRLSRRDVDLTGGMIRIRHPKFDRERLVPLHPSSTEALRRYVARRDRQCPSPGTEMFFISDTGSALRYQSMRLTFVTVLETSGFPTTAGSRPRIHDLRH